MYRRSALLLPSLLLPGLALPGAARAQAPWPTRPVRIVVPFAAGGSTDVSTRLLAPRIQQVLGQSVVIENRGGAGGRSARTAWRSPRRMGASS
jgi:tripartite-type tricarboxylate transporter receptor subunit TctC